MRFIGRKGQQKPWKILGHAALRKSPGRVGFVAKPYDHAESDGLRRGGEILTAGVAHSFTGFPKDGRAWEVIMYGPVQPSVMGQGIDVLLADDSWRRGGRGAARTTWLRRPLGDVAGLPIGSCWKDGVSAPSERRARTAVIEVAPLAGWPDQLLGEAYPTPEANDRPAYPLVGLKSAPVWRIQSGEHSYFVPAIEVIRAVFGPSTGLLRLAVEGGVDMWPTKERRIFDLDASGVDRDDPGLVRIKAYRPLHRREAEVIARIVTDERMRRSFMQVFAGIQRAEVKGAPRFPTTLFPFDQPTQWTVDTEWTHVNKSGGWRRLVTRIHAIRTPPAAFRKVVVELAGGGGEVEPGEKRRAVSRRSPDVVADRIRMDPHRLPVTNLTATPLHGGHTSHDSGFELEHVIVDRTGRKATVVVEEKGDAKIETGSTAWGRGGAEGVAAVTFQSSVVDYPDEVREADAILRSTRSAVELLSQKRAWPCSVISPPYGEGADPRDGLIRYPPSYYGHDLTWSVMQDGRLRRALVMHLATPQGNVYVIDAERQGVAEGHALGLLLTPTRTLLSYEFISDALAFNAKRRGVWSDMTLVHPTVKLKRNATWFNNIQAYCTGLVTPITQLLNGT